MKFLIAGLGNIGDEYAGTRHNIGFEVADELASSLSKESPVKFETGRYASVAELKFRGKTLIILKPNTFMNLSGNAVNYWMHQEKITIKNILVVADDLALPFGTLRIRAKGGDGGHNGLTSIIQILGTDGFGRLRFGIGSEFRKGTQVNYVLGKWNEEEKNILPEKIKAAVEIVKSFLTRGIDLTMTDFNKK